MLRTEGRHLLYSVFSSQHGTMELYELQASVIHALDIAHATRGLRGAEVCASWCEQQVVRLQYDADRPGEAIQAVDTHTTYGVSLLLLMADRAGCTVGFGVSSEDLSQDGILAALEMAKQHPTVEPAPRSLPRPIALDPPLTPLYDAQVLTLSDDELRQAALEALAGALSTLQEAGYVRGLRVSGEVRCRKERLVIGNTHGVLASDTATGLFATVQSQLTSALSRGTGMRAATHWRDFTAYEAGVEAAQQALQAQGSIALGSGDYQVVFGPRAVAALVSDLVLPALSLDTVAAGTSPFAAQRHQAIASPLLTITDDGRLPGMVGSRTLTGDGLPTGTTPLIAHGRLVGFLADAYHAQHLADRVGPTVPRNGMRHATNGASFAMRPGIFPTNVLVSGPDAVALAALLAPIDQGIYVGGLWHTLTPGGLRTGACTSTVIGPSFAIRQGQLAEPLQPGTLRLQDNFLDLLQRLTGLSTPQEPIVLATRQSLVLAPAWRCSQARFLTPPTR